MSQTKNPKYISDKFVSFEVVLITLMYVQVFICLITLTVNGFNELFEALKRAVLWLQMKSKSQDGSYHIWDILASLVYSGRKWRKFVYLLSNHVGN